jgi:hypothetical protein
MSKFMRLSKSLLATLSVVAITSMVWAVEPTSQPTTRPYPLKTCVVSGEDLGSMGNPVVIVHDGREVKFCCKSCVKQFKKDPEKYLKKLDEAAPDATTQPSHEGHH